MAPRLRLGSLHSFTGLVKRPMPAFSPILNSNSISSWGEFDSNFSRFPGEFTNQTECPFGARITRSDWPWHYPGRDMSRSVDGPVAIQLKVCNVWAMLTWTKMSTSFRGTHSLSYIMKVTTPNHSAPRVAKGTNLCNAGWISVDRRTKPTLSTYNTRMLLSRLQMIYHFHLACYDLES